MLNSPRPLVLIRGGGDLASGVALRLHRSGFAALIAEIKQPLAVRRAVAFAEAIYTGEVQVEEVTGRRVQALTEIASALREHVVPVMIDPQARVREDVRLAAIVDARMRKRQPERTIETGEVVIGLGPGFTAGLDCHAVIETNRGHAMGRVIWDGPAEEDTGVPEAVGDYRGDRVLRAPADGVLTGGLEIGTVVKDGDVLARVGERPVQAPFDGVLRGLIHDGLPVKTGMKVGDLDPRGVVEHCFTVSDKALAVGGGVLEALLSFEAIRKALGG
ncbi:MAG: selenium-dependent molybdenum cofactor biosynthesis protein YqeB [Anaerolineales bacterium]|nr:selenium-dependent molybdenum cofactor biosynthesis protein YqeB [Anaerolineales bacterium]